MKRKHTKKQGKKKAKPIVYLTGGHIGWLDAYTGQYIIAMLPKETWDGETGELKAAEVRRK